MMKSIRFREYRKFRRLTVLAIISLALLALNACSPSEASVSTGSSDEPTAEAATSTPEMDEVSLRLSWRWKAEFAPFALAVDKGFFEEQNIDVELGTGKGSGDAVKLVANKEDDFGFLNQTTGATGIAQGMDVRVIAGLVNKSPMALAYFPEQDIDEPKDLEGKTIALSPGEAFAVIWPSFAEQWNIDTSTVRAVQLDPSAKNQAFLEGEIDVLPVFVNNELPQLRNISEKEIKTLVPAEWDFNVMANGLFTHNDLIEENPDLVRRFTAAVIKAFEYSRDHPDEAVDAVTARSEELADQPREILLEQVEKTMELLHSPATEDQPIGWMAEEDWQRAIDLLVATDAIERPESLDMFYTNEFIPVQ